MIHRSFIMPANAKEAKFTAPIAKFLGVVAGPGSIIICALTHQDATGSALVLPNGSPVPAPTLADEQDWIVSICRENDPLPVVSDGYIGSVLTGLGVAAVYVRRETN